MASTSEPVARGRAERMPVVFAGHGSPMNVIEDNRFSRGFAELGRAIPKPKAIVAISAHWFVQGTLLTANPSPRTIHDFSGFPPSLYEIEYGAPGHVDLARRIRGMLGEERAGLSTEWGLDHGTWSVLHHMFPRADIPVIQLSIDRGLSPEGHLAIGKSLAELRHDGVLILGSGNVVHNLRDAITRMRTGNEDTPDWARSFDAEVERALDERDEKALAGLWPGAQGQLAHPSPDHFFPLLYVFGATDERDTVRYPLVGFDLGSVSMRNVIFS